MVDTPSRTAAAFLSLAAVDDPARHAEYNKWHQLDHLPENLALPGVFTGQRFVRTPQDRAASVRADGDFGTAQYATVYWFRPPAEASVAEWSELAETSFQWGRRPDVGWTRRPFMRFLRPSIGMVRPGLEITSQVLPLRPCTGLYLVISEVSADPAARPTLQDRYRWTRTEGLPALVQRAGVAGGWILSDAHELASASWSGREEQADFSLAGYRAQVLFLDGDPLEVAASIAADGPVGVLQPVADDAIERIVLATPLHTITPWQWNWFDRS
jgi:hypothetical protein